MSSCTTTVPNSVRISAPVGQTSRQAASVQCLQTSLDISQRMLSAAAAGVTAGICTVAGGTGCSMNATCRQVEAPRADGVVVRHPGQLEAVLGHLVPVLQATSQALQPMHTEVSVKKPIRGG